MWGLIWVWLRGVWKNISPKEILEAAEELVAMINEYMEDKNKYVDPDLRRALERLGFRCARI